MFMLLFRLPRLTDIRNTITRKGCGHHFGLQDSRTLKMLLHVLRSFGIFLTQCHMLFILHHVTGLKIMACQWSMPVQSEETTGQILGCGGHVDL